MKNLTKCRRNIKVDKNIINIEHFFQTNRVFMENMRRAKKGYIMAICSVAGKLQEFSNKKKSHML